ncbi:MAG TPA: thiamine pyrophosphate-dependent enzyme, partial [Deinococcales bacterium]|nr:thiamine pyrophosphate-dependent enzyme [Deinococcales bacterium]
FVNNIHGTIRMHQEKHYPGRPIATDLTNPGFADLARSFGLTAWTVTDNGEFKAAFAEAVKSDGPTLIEVIEGKERLSVWGKK